MRDMHDATWQAIDAPDDGAATTFTLLVGGENTEGFVVRHQSRLHAYLNRCPHTGSPLDWVPGRFFSDNGETLVCHTHGALFAADNGSCLSGPCPHGLTPLPLHEQNGTVFVPCALDTPE